MGAPTMQAAEVGRDGDDQGRGGRQTSKKEERKKVKRTERKREQ